MTVRVRLQRFGRRNRPFYRVVVADSRAPRDGKFIELVGTYNPLATRSGVKEVTFKVDRIRYWISVGAQPSDRVAWLLGQFGILPPKVVPVARTKQIMPRKEWKELQKQKQAGGKGFHTSAAAAAAATSLTAPQPSCYAGIGEPHGSFLPSVLGPSFGGGGVGVGGDHAPEKASQNCPNIGGRFFESPLSFRWATGKTAAVGSSRARCCDSDAVGDDIATRLSQMSLGVSDRGQQLQQVRSMSDSDTPSLSPFAPLHAVLASNLALLGPSACSTIGVRVEADGVGDAR